MRPLRLELEGFTAFRERTEIHFDGADLFVLCGPTGSGKSSLIDAICFALYGSVPRYNNTSLVAPVISQGRLEARVRFDFSMNGVEHTAVRVVRRTKSGATTPEARLESAGRVLAGSVRELDAKIAELFGLSFDQFTTCVVLPQGEFARFLHEQPRERQGLLRELLALRLYEGIRRKATEREAAAKQRAERLRGQLDPLADATAARRKELRARLRELKQLKKTVAAADKQIAELDARTREQLAVAKQQERDAKLAAAIQVPARVERLGEEATQATAKLKQSTAEREAAERDVLTCEGARSELGDPAPREALLAAHDDYLKKKTARVEAAGREQAASSDRKKADQALAAARAALEAARERSAEIVRANAAHHLASGLTPGGDCPVCRRPLDEMPAHPTPAGLDQAQRDGKAAALALERAEAAATAALSFHTREQAQAEILDQALAELERRLADQPDRADVEATLAEIVAADRRLAAARKAAREAQTAEHAARVAGEGLVERIQIAWKSYDAKRERVIALGPPPPDRDDLAESWRGLARWSAECGQALTDSAAQAREAANRLQSEAAVVRERVEQQCVALDLTLDSGPAAEVVLQALTATERDLEDIVDRIERAKRVATELTETEERRQVASRLAQHLRSDNFERWLLLEAFDRLVLAGGARLRELSGGAYSFRVDDRLNFDVVDHRNADETRSVRTLSGGETFLASLALALALADQVSDLAAAGAARLDSIFLDEGFGTLDADTLDVVAATIEELGSAGRVVGIVTHVRDLADRVPVQFRVTKGPVTSTVERVTS